MPGRIEAPLPLGLVFGILLFWMMASASPVCAEVLPATSSVSEADLAHASATEDVGDVASGVVSFAQDAARAATENVVGDSLASLSGDIEAIQDGINILASSPASFVRQLGIGVQRQVASQGRALLNDARRTATGMKDQLIASATREIRKRARRMLPLPNLSLPSREMLMALLKPKGAKQAYERLAKMGAKAVPELRVLLNDKNLRLLRAGLDLAEKLQTPTGELAQDLSRVLLNPRLGSLRVRAARVLGQLGDVAKDSLPALITALGDKNGGMRQVAAETVLDVILNGRKGLSNLGKSLADRKSPLRKALLEGVAAYGQTLHPALPLVVAYARKGKIETSDVVSLVMPKLLPKLLPGLTGLFPEEEPMPEWALVEADEEIPAIGPDSVALEEEIAAANKADEALSFEDIPAGED